MNGFFRNLDRPALFACEKTQWLYVIYYHDFNRRYRLGCNGADCGVIGNERISERDTRSIVERRTSCRNRLLRCRQCAGLAEFARICKRQKEVLASAPYVSDQALLANAGEVRGVQIRGILPSEEKNVVDYGKDMPAGSFDDLKPGEFDIILGQGLAEALGTEIGGKVTVITPEGNVTPAGVVPRLKQFNVVGVVKTGVYEVDNTLAMTHIKDAQVLYRLGENVGGLRLRLADPQNAPSFIAKLIPDAKKDEVWVRDWTFNNRSYFEAVELEKRMMFIILTLIIAVAAFNLVSSLVMAVTEKQADIAILRTLGLSPGGVMKIFLVQGAFAGFFGTLVGVVCGVLLGWNVGKIVAFFEDLFGVHLINSQVYFIDYLPSDVNLKDVAVIACISLGLAFIATLYPSWRAAKTQPAEALRYE